MTDIVIPTPRGLNRLPGSGRTWKTGSTCRLVVAGGGTERVDFAVRFLRDRLRQSFGLRTQVVAFAGGQTVRPDDVLLCGDGDARVARRLSAPSKAANELATEQGYIIQSRAGEPAVLYARAPVGLLYAVTTLLQLLTRRGDTVHLSDVVVQDQPEYRWRGNSWLVHAELVGWSYGRGDGRRAYEQRVIRKLDLCAMHKINYLHFHGYDWDVNSFPGHAPMMRRLNREAKLRGMRLSFSGQGSYQAGFTNRRSYPDGEEYPCIGYINHEATRLCGTCLSNRDLLRLRQQQIGTFVREIEPGALYLHSIDTGTVADSAPIWNLRCPACRKRWPNDAIIAPDGMAGAYAAFYDAMGKAVHSVDPDCLLTVISPAYTSWEESDKDWEQACEYWLTVSRCLRDRKIQIGLREQFMRHDSTRLRYVELRKRLDREAHGHRISCILFYGGDNFYNGHPFVAAPIVSNHFQDVELVVNGNGTAYQEPQQLLNAECLWNPRGSGYFTPPRPEDYQAFRRRYVRLSSATDRPSGIWKDFLGDACNRLYGPQAGPIVADIYRLRGKTRLGSPSYARYERTPVWLPVYHYLHPVPAARAFRQCGVAWRKVRSRKEQALSRRLIEVYRETSRLNRQAAAMARRAAKKCVDPHAAADLAWMADTLDAARRCANLLGPYVELFIKAHRAATTGRGTPRVLAAIASFSRRAAAFDLAEKKRLPRTILPDEAELVARMNAGNRLERTLTQMQQTLTTGQWP